MNTQDRRRQEIECFTAQKNAQRMTSLGIANEVRLKRASLKRDLKAGRRSIYDILISPPEYVQTMLIFDLIFACPKYGRVKAYQILRECKISSSRRIENMTLRERTEVVSRVRR